MHDQGAAGHQDGEVLAALRTLGAEAATSWEDVRRAYRDQLMANHPDAGGGPDAAGRTDRIVAAFRLLRDRSGDGSVEIALPALVSTESPASAGAGDGPIVLHAKPGDVFVRLCEAASVIGHLSYADPAADLLQVTIAESGGVGGAWAPSQLTAELRAEGSKTMVMFSLEPLGTGTAPPIAEVVSRLADALVL